MNITDKLDKWKSGLMEIVNYLGKIKTLLVIDWFD